VDEFSDLMSRGGRAAQARDWATAEECFRAAIAIYAKSGAAHLQLAIALHNRGRLADAIAACRSSLKHEPADTIANHVMGLLFLDANAPEEAEAQFMKALDLDPLFPDPAFQIGKLADRNDRVEQAISYYQRTLQSDPRHGAARSACISLLTELRRLDEAAAIAKDGIRLCTAANSADRKKRRMLRMLLADVYLHSGLSENAARCYREILAEDPESAAVKHLLAAATGVTTTAYASAYVEYEFDNLAPTFEDRLVRRLRYSAPQILAQGTQDLRPGRDALAAVLDLGCGTGLVGAALTKHYEIRSLVGIDLSQRMLELARERSIYHELLNGELVDAMAMRSDEFDLVIAADVFIYVGWLESVFVQVARLLKPNGLFAFSTEISDGDDVQLAPSGRYRHRPHYVQRLTAENRLRIVREIDAPLRFESNALVNGCYTWVARPA
jgi:predicted TPR repeat methyltransferase